MNDTPTDTPSIYKLVTEGGDRRHAWRTTEAEARRYAERLGRSGERLVGPRGEIVMVVR